MPARRMMIGVDLARVYAAADAEVLVRTLCWGDEVEVDEVNEEHVRLKTTTFETQSDGSIMPVPVVGFVLPPVSSGIEPSEAVVDKEEARGVFKVDFVDFQQGDASVMETPGGKVVLIDGGDNQLFACYLANRYRGTTEALPKEVECVLVSQNGHSVVLRVRYGAFRFLFAGDLNEESETELAEAHGRGEVDLRSEVLKVPHHGSHDFLPAFMGAVSPVVSVVSSGDESARTEHIHPRATLMGALGRHSRVDEPLIFVTELVAFFARKGWVRPEFHELVEQEDGGQAALVRDGRAVVDPDAVGSFYAFERTAFGLVRVRTDGERMLVFTNSGQADLKEAYAYSIAPD